MTTQQEPGSARKASRFPGATIRARPGPHAYGVRRAGAGPEN